MPYDIIKIAYQTEVIFNLWLFSFRGIFGVLFSRRQFLCLSISILSKMKTANIFIPKALRSS